MKKLGLVGGTGPESTLIYYKDINYIVNKMTNGLEFPELSIESINLYKGLELCKLEQYEELLDYLLSAVNNLAAAGAEFAALSANTMHIVYDELKEKSPIPLVSIIEATCEEAKRQGMKKLGLLGTIFTMKGDFFKRPFTSYGIDIVTPDEETMQLVNNRIANELELGVVKEETKAELINVINEMKKNQGIEAVILGCTELPLAINNDNCPIPFLDTMKIHIDTLARLIVEKN